MDEVFCAKCGQNAQYKCERCLEAYCSSQCQVNDWPIHKSRCYKFPNLIPINILKSVSSNLYLNRIEGFQSRHSSSTRNVNDTRRSNVSNNDKKLKTKMMKDNDFIMVPKSTTTMCTASVVNSVVEKPNTWRTAFQISDGFFEAMVQFKEEENEKRIVWVTDLKYAPSLRKLLSEINRTINQKIPCNEEDIYVGALVAAPLDKILYRAEILKCCPESRKATVRLIDYGNEISVSYFQLFAPIPIMCNLNAYAFRVCMPNDYGSLEIESIVKIKIIGEKQDGNYYNVECKIKSISLHLPIGLLNKDHILKFVKSFSDGRTALLRLCNDDDIDDTALNNFFNSPESLIYEFASLPNVGAFVVARTQYGWKRARLLGFYERPHQFLIYALDDGFVSFSPQIKKVPESFITQPIRVFAISTNSSDCMLSEVMLSTAKSLSLQLLPSSSANFKDSKTQLYCSLFDEERKIVDIVMASVFTGFYRELGLKLWYEPINEGDTVVVSHVLTYKKIYIVSKQYSEYSKILTSEYLKCIPFSADETIDRADIVMYCNDARELQYCRGQVIKCDSKLFKVKDIDSGCEHLIARKFLRKPTVFACSLPVRCFLVTLMYLESIPTPITNNKALEALQTCMYNAVEFDVTFDENKSVDLLFRTKEKQSLCKKLLPMVFEHALKQITKVPENAIFPLSPPHTPITYQPNLFLSNQSTITEELFCTSTVQENKIFTTDDLEIVPITCGENIPLYVLDASTILNIESPYITAADYKNKEFLLKMEQYLKAVAEYCKSDKVPKNGYAPKKMEICLSVFEEDGEWYRALCIDHISNDTFIVMFLDFGNVSKVNKMDIMPMIQDLMFPSNANMVYVEDITTKEQAIAFKNSIEKIPIIKANVSRLMDTDAYTAKICN